MLYIGLFFNFIRYVFFLVDGDNIKVYNWFKFRE